MLKKLKRITLLILIFCLGIVGYYTYSFAQFAMTISKPKVVASGNTSQESEVQKPPVYELPEWEGTERVNILLLGGDGRVVEDAGRSDSMMLVSIEPGTNQIHLFSILRDTYVNIPGHGKNKINAALAFGGPELSMKAVSDLIGLPVHYYYYIDLDSFIKLVDAVGGVELEVEKDMKYLDPTDKPEYQINLKKGMQLLDGNKALQYVRFRKDAMSDYTRTERQRKFLGAMAEKLQSTSTLVSLPSLLKEIAPYIQTNMSPEKMLKLAVSLHKGGTRTIHTAQLPPMELLREEKINGAAVITVNATQLQKYVTGQLQQTETKNEEQPSVQ
ncbi:LCP family protein [Brevibacillus reuszeri]|uniref:LCP family protein n=1 Tax=Brevibacillus reuszeri TaxID=54915 RepID=UPI00289D1CDE|nr:LCP family protein [Brevibacillus reuszeri]